jgi:hypothetical protein
VYPSEAQDRKSWLCGPERHALRRGGTLGLLVRERAEPTSAPVEERAHLL